MDVLWKAFHLNWKEWPSPSCSVTKSCTALGSHGLQHARLLCPSLSPRVCSNSRPLSQQCYLTISSSAALLSFCHQSCPASGSFPVNQLFASRDQSTGASGSTISHSNYIQGWFPLGWTGLISLLPISSSALSLLFFFFRFYSIYLFYFFCSNSHIHIWILEKP